MKPRHFIPVLLLLIIFSGCKTESYKEVPQYSIEQFMNTTRIFGSAFSPDESKILFSSDETGIYNAYTVPVSGGEPTQLTHSTDDAVLAISFFPHDERILYRGDKGGNEIWHLYVREFDGSTRDLTPEEKARAVFYGWSHDDKSFFFGWNKRDPKFMDIYEMDVESLTPQLLYQNDAGYNFGGISNDKNYMALSKSITRNNSEMYLMNLITGELKHLSPHEGEINYNPVAFSPDSKTLYYLTDEGSEFTYLQKYDIVSGEKTTVEQTDWDIMYGYLSETGKYRVVGINEDARTVIRIYDTESNEPIDLPKVHGNITSVNISKSESKMAFYMNGSTSPNNLYIYDFGTARYTKLTDTMNPEIKPADLVEAKVIRYKSFDGLEIPALLYRPHQIKPGEKVPALVWVHGGPGGQSRIGYSDAIQYLVNHGYVVLAVNNRGSSGYGKTFFKLDDMKHGEDDLDDCVKAKDFLAETGYVDAQRIGIIGGSYGGYMVLAGLAFRPDEFALGVDIFGVANWVRTLQSIPPWWEAFRESLYKELGNPETDLEYLKRISPLFHADQIKKPLLVLQGANDPRVLKVESDEIVAAVKKNGVPVEYVVFDDEGHGFRKKENRRKGWQTILKFLDTYLKEAQPPEAVSSKL